MNVISISFCGSLSLDLPRPTVAASEIPSNKLATAARASASSYTMSSSLDTADTFHTASSPCSVLGEHDAVNGGAKGPNVDQGSTGSMNHVGACVGCIDSDELSSAEDSYNRAAADSSGIIHSEHSTSSFEKISPLTEVHSDTQREKSQLMNAKVSKFLLRIRVIWDMMLHHWVCVYQRSEGTVFLSNIRNRSPMDALLHPQRRC